MKMNKEQFLKTEFGGELESTITAWDDALSRNREDGKKPTLAQKKFLQDTGLDSEKWLIVKDTPEEMVIVSRIALQRRSGKTKTIRKAKK